MPGLRPPERDIGVANAPIRSLLALVGLFLVALLACALIERLGLGTGLLPVAIVLSVLAVATLIAIAAHGRRPVDYYVADRSVSPALGGLAGASGVAGLLIIGVVGGDFATAAEIVIFAAGLLLGVLAAALLFAPGLRRLGAYTPADLLAARFGEGPARLAGALLAFAPSLLLLVAQLATAGPLLAALLGLSPRGGAYMATALTAMAVLPGGMRSLTWAQIILFVVTVLACFAPAALLAAFGTPEGEAAASGLVSSFLSLSLPPGALQGAALPILVVAAGSASLAPLLARSLTAPNGRAARTSMLWAALLGLGLMLGVLVLGDLIASQPDAEPRTAFGGDALLLATPILADLPSVLAGLAIAGLLAGVFAAGQAALLSAAGALSNDLWDTFVDRSAPDGRRLLVARILVIAVAAGAAWLALNVGTAPPALIGWALALAAAGNFAPLLLGIWWRGATPHGALAGMATGVGLLALSLLLPPGNSAGLATGSALAPIQAAAVAIPAALFVTVLVSVVTKRRDERQGAELAELFAVLRGGHRKPPLRERPA